MRPGKLISPKMFQFIVIYLAQIQYQQFFLLKIHTIVILLYEIYHTLSIIIHNHIL